LFIVEFVNLSKVVSSQEKPGNQGKSQEIEKWSGKTRKNQGNEIFITLQ